MPAVDFQNKVVLVTGASSGIGRALAAEFGRQGAQVLPVSRSGPERADVRDPAQVGAVVTRALERFGRIDVLVNNAGIGYCATVEDTPLEDYREVFETNFWGAFHFLKAVLPGMIERRSGLIIQISSLNGFCAVPLASAYCASKFALEGLSQSARLELHPHNIRMLIVRPGVTDTGFFDHAKHFRQNNPFPLRHPMPAEVAAKQIVRAAARGKRELVLTAEGRALWWLKKFSPTLVDHLVLRHVRARPLAA